MILVWLLWKVISLWVIDYDMLLNFDMLLDFDMGLWLIDMVLDFLHETWYDVVDWFLIWCFILICALFWFVIWDWFIESQYEAWFSYSSYYWFDGWAMRSYFDFQFCSWFFFCFFWDIFTFGAIWIEERCSWLPQCIARKGILWMDDWTIEVEMDRRKIEVAYEETCQQFFWNHVFSLVLIKVKDEKRNMGRDMIWIGENRS